MADKAIAFQDGPFLTSGTFHDVINAADAGTITGYAQPLIDGSDNTTTAYVAKSNSSFDGPLGISTDGVMLYCERNVGATGTFSVKKYEIGHNDEGEVTVNVADLPASGSPAWVFFKFAAPYVTSNSYYHNIGVKSSVDATVKVYRSAATAAAWAFLTRKTSVARVPVAGDTAFIVGELTGAGTGTDRFVTPGVETSITVTVGQRGYHYSQTVTWTNGGGDFLWTTGTNWSGGGGAAGIPAINQIVAISGSPAIDMNETTKTVAAISAASFTGSLANGTIVLTTGTSSFGACSTTGLSALRINGSVTLSGSTAAHGLVQVLNSTSTLTLATDITCDNWIVGTGGTVALSTHKLIANNGQTTTTSIWTWGSGGELKFISGSPILALQIGGAASPSFPPIEIAGSAYADADFTCQSFTLTSGTWNCTGSGAGKNITTIAGFTLTAGTLSNPASRTFTIPGNFSDTGVALSGGTFVVTGTAVAVGVAINNTSFAGGTTLDATSGCSGAGDTNVNFGINLIALSRGAFAGAM